MNTLRKFIFWVVLSTSRPIAFALLNINQQPTISVMFLTQERQKRERQLKRRYKPVNFSYTLYLSIK